MRWAGLSSETQKDGSSWPSGQLLRFPRARPAFLRLRSGQGPLKPEFSDTQQAAWMRSAARRGRDRSGAMAILAMLGHGQDARGMPRVRVGGSASECRAFRDSAAFRLLGATPDHRLCPPGKPDHHVKSLIRILIIQWMFIILRTAESERGRLCATRSSSEAGSS